METTDRPNRFGATVEAARGSIIVPRAVRVRDAALEWSSEAPGWDGTLSPAEHELAGTSHYPRGHSDIEVLDRFIKLYRAPDQQIVDFARHFGVLYLSPGGVPNSEPNEVEYLDETFTGINLVRTADGNGSYLGEPVDRPVRWHREPLQYWRDWSLLVRLLLLYGLELRSTTDRVGPEDRLRQWQIELPPAEDGNERWFRSEPISLIYQLSYEPVGSAQDNQHRLTTANEQRATLGFWLDILMSHAGTGMRLDWKTGVRPQVRVGRARSAERSPHGVFGDVMVQLVNTLLGDREHRICPGCAEPFEPEGKEQRCNQCREARKRATQKQKWDRHGAGYNQRRRDRAKGT